MIWYYGREKRSLNYLLVFGFVNQNGGIKSSTVYENAILPKFV